MFERLTPAAKQVLRGAIAEAKRRGDQRAGTEHLLVAVAAAPLPFGQDVLGPLTHGGDTVRAALDELDRAALAAVGVDLDAELGPDGAGLRIVASEWPPRRRRPSLTEGARDTIVRSLQEAVRLGDRRVGAAHVLLALTALHADDAAARVLAHLGVDRLELRTALLGAVRRTA